MYWSLTIVNVLATLFAMVLCAYCAVKIAKRLTVTGNNKSIYIVSVIILYIALISVARFLLDFAFQATAFQERPATVNSTPLVDNKNQPTPPTLPSKQIRNNDVMYEAVKAGNLEKIDDLLAHGGNLNDLNYLGWTPMTAISLDSRFSSEEELRGNLDLLKQLIQRGADVNQRNESGFTELIRIARTDNLEAANLLIAHGAQINVHVLYSEDTPLHVAVQEGQVKMVELLLSHGAEINAKNKHKQTPLHIAAYKQDLSLVDLLLINKANLHLVDDELRTPLYLATKATEPISERKTSERKRLALITLLLDNGADINVQKDTGLTPLMCALYDGNLNIAKFLIDKGADVKIKSADGITALDLAAKNGVLVDIEKQINEREM